MDSIKDTANTLKASLIENLVSNVKEQKYASLFHMEGMITLDEPILLLEKLHTLYDTNYVQCS